MSYTPTSIPIYVAAYSGAIAGMGASGRVLSDSTPSHYATLAAVAGAWAQEFDTRYSGPTDTLSVTMAEDLSVSGWEQRAPGLAGIFLQPSNYQIECDALIAMITAAETYFAGQGITPPPVGGGGSGDTWQTDIFTATDDQVEFNLDEIPNPDEDLILFVNGTAYRNGVDYVVASNEVTWLKPFDLVAGDFVLALYPYIPS